MITRVSFAAGALLSGLFMAGCITVYQPMSGLHRPVAIDTRMANFKDTTVRIQCVPAKFVGKSDMSKLCRRVGRLFENQGAQVQTEVSRGRVISDPEPSEKTVVAADRVILDVELRSRRVHAQTAFPFFWDDEADITFAQDIVIRDETGFLLVRETLTGRFVRRIGWSSNANEDFSRDYYGQLTQLAFNARMRWTVAGGGQGRVAPKPPADGPNSAASAGPGAGLPALGGVAPAPAAVNRLEAAPASTVAP